MEYYARLQAVRTKSDWEGWVKYFLTAVWDTAEDSWKRAEESQKTGDKVFRFHPYVSTLKRGDR